jgi:hypothetical protein
VTSAGSPVGGATVTLNPGGTTTTTAADGSYQFASVPFGSYTLNAVRNGQCGVLSGTGSAAVDGARTVDIAATQSPRGDTFGYTCTEGAQSYLAAGTVLALTGDDNIKQVTLPFPVRLYGTSYSTAWVDTNGVVSLVNPGGSAVNWNTHLPGTAAPNAAVYPFWDDFFIDSAASIRTATVGTAPNRSYVVEWRNAAFYSNRSARVTAEVIFTETTGEITFVYTGIDPTAMEQGSTAVVGIENSAGTVGFEYSYHLTVLRTGNGVTFRPPA